MKSVIESLGFRPDEAVVIVHADDVGMCHAQNRGAFECLAAGLVSCASIMVPCPWFPEAAAYARTHPEADLGIHLTLNSEHEHYGWGPVAGPDRVLSLVDERGYFPRTLLETVATATPEDVETELRAQIDRALRAGVDVTHLDTHMGTVMVPKFFGIYLALARAYRLPAFLPRPDAEILEQRGLSPPLVAEMARQMGALERAGWPIVDHMVIDSLAAEPAATLDHYRERFSSLKPGLTHLLLHPAAGTDELRAITPDWEKRAAEHRLFTSGALEPVLAERRAQIVGYRALRDLVRSGRAADAAAERG